MNLDTNKKIKITAIFLGIVALLILCIANSQAISAWFSTFFAVLSPILIGAITAYLCNFILRLFESRVFKKVENPKVNRTLSILMTYLVVIALITAFLFLLLPQFLASCQDLMSKLDGYIKSATTYVNQIVHSFAPMFGDRLEGFELTEQDIMNWITKFFNNTEDLMQSVVTYITQYAGKLITGLKNLVIGLFISIYFLFSKEKLAAFGKKIAHATLAKPKAEGAVEVAQLADKTFGGFITGQLLDACFITVVGLIVFSIFKIPHAFLISVIVGITNIIPFFGPFIGAIPSAFIVFIAEPSKALLFIFLILIIQQVEGNIIAPKIIGNVTGLSSLGVIIAIVLSSGFLGIIGMFIGVPLYAVIVTLINRTLDKRLAAKNLPTSLGNYYSPKALITYEDENKKSDASLVQSMKKIAMWVAKLFSQLVHAINSYRNQLKLRARKRKEQRQLKARQKNEHDSESQS